MPTYFVDMESGNDNYGGSSFSVLASGVDGAIATPPATAYSVFSSAGANFPNDGTIASTKNEAWYTNCFYLNTIPTNTTINMTSITPPSGINSTVYSLLEDSSSSTHYIQSTTWYTPIYQGTQYTLSIYAKAAGRNKVIIRYSGSDAKTARYNLSNGTVEATGASASSSITSLGNGWYRLSLTFTTGDVNTSSYSGDNWEIFLLEDSFTSLTPSSSSYFGNSRDGVLLCAMQIETGSSVTTYERPPLHSLSIFNGTSYISFYITERISSTSLRINLINGGTAISAQSSRQYFIGGRWKNISAAGGGPTAVRTIPGDTIRIEASPYPTVLGSGTWSTLSGLAGSARSNVLIATNTSPISVTCASTMATLGINNGDTVIIHANTANTNSNGTWTVTSVSGSSCSLVGSSGNFNQTTSNGLLTKMTHRVVTLNNAVTANIASFGNRGNGRTVWTASSNVTADFDTTTSVDSKEGDVSDRIAIGAAFTTGKAAYKSTGSLNLSSYQQLSFFIKQTAGTIAVSGDISLRLCSDTIGDTTVHTFNVPPMLNLNVWIPFTIDLGSAMNSSIQSVALYVDADKGAQTFLLSNILACKAPSTADSLTLQSLISKNTGDECWYPIMSINGSRIMLGQGNAANTNFGNSTTSNRGGYYGVTENVLTYKRETIKVAMTSAATSVNQAPQEAGAAGNPMSWEFGYDRTNMSTRDSQTYIDGINGLGYGFFTQGYNYFNVSNLGLVRFDRGFRHTSAFGNFDNIETICCTTIGLDFFAHASNSYGTLKSCCNGSTNFISDFGGGTNVFNKVISIGSLAQGLLVTRGGGANNKFNYILSANNTFGLFVDNGTDSIYTSGNFFNNATDGVRTYGCKNDRYYNCVTSGHTGGNGFFSFGGDMYLYNCIINEPVEFGNYGTTNGRISSINHDNTSGNYLISVDYGLVRPQTSVRYSNNGYAWSLAPTNSLYRTSSYPLDLKIATIAVSANAQVTIKAWVRRTSMSLTMGLRIKGGQIAGVTNDITSYMTAAADTWQQITLNFTPTESGIVDILAECWGGSTFTGYIDDLTIIQV